MGLFAIPLQTLIPKSCVVLTAIKALFILIAVFL
ncbi:hypothetical protein FHU10_4867 [Serratia fonticola]|uniref:Uncharacterized protein n=1 Tax=Serratia fonticola TaxID=47917 RepID=A0A542BNV5_SERFO|nr:hypothetical protein FHU09_2836 [Serratia fonticola]TQI97700.1 hypothetical protein FHU11_3207 [Serratia fonticola]TVZ72198.1 hypothetical protein FHU10_4867 [Serratia fonticola]